MASLPTLREQVYTHLKRRLNDGSMKPGAFLDLNALGEDLGLSRTPLRDALLRLEAEGFVTIHARRGVVVNALDIHTIRNSYQLLGSLEAAAIKEAAASFSTDDAKRMLALFADAEALAAISEWSGSSRNVSMTFHDLKGT